MFIFNKIKISYFVLVSSWVIFFIFGVSLSKRLLPVNNSGNNNATTPTSVKSTIPFNIPQVPLPPDWALKEGQPGNSFGTSFPLNPGIKTQGTLNTDNAIDYYVFSLKDPSQIIVDVTDIPKSLYWILYDNQFKELASAYRKGTSSGSTQISLQNPGKYYLKVWSDYNEVANYPYTIRLSILPYFD